MGGIVFPFDAIEVDVLFKAAEVANKLACMNPNEDKNHTAYVRSGKAFDAGRFTEAIAWFKQAVAEWPEDYQAHWALGNSYSAAGKHSRAALAFRHALGLAPEREQAAMQFNLGNALFAQGEFANALVAFEAIPSGSPVHRAAVRNAALARSALNK